MWHICIIKTKTKTKAFLQYFCHCTVSHMSDAAVLSYGVPQGSVLGPLLLFIHMLPLSLLIRCFNIAFNIFADGT